MATHTASIRLEEDKLARLDRLAKSLNRSRSWVVNQSIDRYLDYEEWFSDAVAMGTEAADAGKLVPHGQALDEAREHIDRLGETKSIE